MNTEDGSNYLAKVYYDSANTKLALLKFRKDCSVYIELVDVLKNTSDTLETRLFLSANEAMRISNSGYIPQPYSDAYSYNKDHQTITNHRGEVIQYSTASYLLSFKVDFENGKILIEAPITDVTINLTTVDILSERRIILFGTDGMTHVIPIKNEYYPDKTNKGYAYLIDYLYVIYFSDYDGNEYLYILNTETHTIYTVNPHLVEDEAGNESYYHEYIQEFIFREDLLMAAYTCDSPNAGAIGLRVIKIMTEEPDVKMIFSIDEDDRPPHIRRTGVTDVVYGFQSITFDFFGENFAVLHTAASRDKGESYSTFGCTIRIYNLHNAEIPPILINAGVTKHIIDSGTIDFITDAVIVMRTDRYFSFYDIESREEIKEIPFEELTHFHVPEII